MELKIITPDEAFLKAVEFNGEELKQELSLRLEKYKGLQYNDDEIKLAKTDRATLNKFKTALEDKRKEVKNLCLAPYERFEIKIKELVNMVDLPITEIDNQVKAFEESQKDEKKTIIGAVYDETIGDLRDILPLKRLWNDRWLNATYKLGLISEEIVTAIKKVADDLVQLSQLNSEFDLQIKDKFLQTLDLSQALAEKTRLETAKAKMEEYNRQQEEKKRKYEEEKLSKAQVETTGNIVEAPLVIPATMVPNLPVENPSQIEQVLEILDFRVYVTVEQKTALKNFLIQNSIKYKKVGN